MDEFDYIVVGAGSAGCALAHGLASRSDYRVLLIEQGERDQSPLFHMPKGFGALLAGDRHVSRYQVSRGDHKAGSEVWLRGKALGGSSSVNGMIWIRPRPEQVQRLGSSCGSGWSYARLEDHVNALDGSGGGNGYFQVSPHRDQYPITEQFLLACEQKGLPRRTELSEFGDYGAGYLHYNIDGRGRRQSAASVFLRGSGEQKNLQVRTGLLVDRIIFSGQQARAVLCQEQGREVVLQARKGVILSAGAIESPLILQRSGIGPRALLEELNIPVIHENVNVGRNLREHFIAGVGAETRELSDSENRQYSGWRLASNLLRYYTRRSGPMSQSPCHAAAFVKSSKTQSCPDVMLMFSPFSRDGDGFSKRAGVSLSVYAMYPESTGDVALISRQPGQAPRISMEYLQTDYDRHASIAGLRAVQGILKQEPFSARVLADSCALSGAETDDELLAVFKRLGQPGFHAVGSCAMGEDDESSVVDARARVHGVSSLRVVDCSMLPQMISGVTNASIMALAMRASDLILEDAGCS